MLGTAVEAVVLTPLHPEDLVFISDEGEVFGFLLLDESVHGVRGDGFLATHTVCIRRRLELFMGVREAQEPQFQEEALDYETFAGGAVVQMNLNYVDADDMAWESPRPSIVAFSLP